MAPLSRSREDGLERRSPRRTDESAETHFRRSDGKEWCRGMTTLTVRDPFLAAPFRLMEQWLGATGNDDRVTGFRPLVDVRETAEEYFVMVDLPGVKQEDVTVEVHDQ